MYLSVFDKIIRVVELPVVVNYINDSLNNLLAVCIIIILLNTAIDTIAL